MGKLFVKICIYENTISFRKKTKQSIPVKLNNFDLFRMRFVAFVLSYMKQKRDI